jgi:hypothetical protein
MEPESVRSYHPSFLNQFAIVITCQKGIRHRDIRFHQQAQPWNLGAIRHPDGRVTSDLGFEQFRTAPPKSKQLSVASTRKVLTEGHLRRIRFIEEIKAVLGNRLDVHWLGPETTTDKRSAILPYRYHIALENSSYPHYWTEKLADCYLGGAFPIYYGCPNLEDYFPRRSFAAVDINDAVTAAQVIDRVLAEGWSSERQRAIDEARMLVLEKYNFYAMVVETLKNPPREPAVPVTLLPESHFSRLWTRARRAVCRWINP